MCWLYFVQTSSVKKLNQEVLLTFSKLVYKLNKHNNFNEIQTLKKVIFLNCLETSIMNIYLTKHMTVSVNEGRKTGSCWSSLAGNRETHLQRSVGQNCHQIQTERKWKSASGIAMHVSICEGCVLLNLQSLGKNAMCFYFNVYCFIFQIKHFKQHFSPSVCLYRVLMFAWHSLAVKKHAENRFDVPLGVAVSSSAQQRRANSHTSRSTCVGLYTAPMTQELSTDIHQVFIRGERIQSLFSRLCFRLLKIHH